MKKLSKLIKQNYLLIIILLSYWFLVLLLVENPSLDSIMENLFPFFFHIALFYFIFITFLGLSLTHHIITIRKINLKAIILSVLSFCVGLLARFQVFFPFFERSILVVWVLDAAKHLNFQVSGPLGKSIILSFIKGGNRLYGLSLLVKFSFIFLPKTADAILIVNMVLGSLAPILMYYLAKELFKEKRISIFVSIFLFLCPSYLFISSTESYTAPAIFFSILSFTFLFKFFKTKKTLHLIISLLALCLTIFMRLEYILVIIPYFISFLYNYRKKLSSKHIYIIIIFLFLILPHSFGLLKDYSVSGKDIYLHGKVLQDDNWIKGFSSNYLRLGMQNFIPNLKVLFSNSKILIIPIILSMFAIPFVYKKYRKQFVFISSYFWTFFLAYTFMHREGFSNSGLKYITSLIIPITLLASYGLFQLNKIIKSIANKRISTIFTIIILSLFIYHSITEINELVVQNIQNPYVTEYRLLKKANLDIDKNCRLICNGRDCMLSAAYEFNARPLKVYDWGDFEKLQNQDPENCDYFYIGYFDINMDQTEKMQRVYDIKKLRNDLELRSFMQIYNSSIDNQRKIFLYKKD